MIPARARRRGVPSQVLRDLRAKGRARSGLTPGPWMKAKELDIISDALAACSPAHCLEWGAGGSTLYFPQRIPGLVQWTSIEHHAPWFEKVRDAGVHSRVSLVLVPPDQGEFPDASREGTYEEFRSYVHYPTRLGGQFDFILVDGRARAACLRQAHDLITDQGLVVLHDANRDHYVEDLPPFAHQWRLTDYRKGRGGILLASRGRAIEEFVDVGLHQRLWRGHDRLARWLRMR